jgi:hypothetical protein
MLHFARRQQERPDTARPFVIQVANPCTRSDGESRRPTTAPGAEHGFDRRSRLPLAGMQG